MYHRKIPSRMQQLITFGDTKLEGDNKLSDFGVEHGSTVLMTTSLKLRRSVLLVI